MTGTVVRVEFFSETVYDIGVSPLFQEMNRPTREIIANCYNNLTRKLREQAETF